MELEINYKIRSAAETSSILAVNDLILCTIVTYCSLLLNGASGCIFIVIVYVVVTILTDFLF
jgi:hypothetical protein